MADTLVTQAKIAFTEFNVCQDHGAPHFIRLCDDVVVRLEQDAAIRKGEAFGILLGTIESGQNCTITVENFEPAGVVEQHIRAWIPPSGSDQIVVGYYRSLSQAGFTLDEADRALFERCFPRDARVALLVKSSKAGPGTATFFLGEHSRLDSERMTVEFPFDLQQLAGEGPPAATPEPISKPARGGLSSKLLMTGAALIASVVGLNALGVFDRLSTSTWIPEQKPAAVTPPAVPADSPKSQPAPSDVPQPEKTEAVRPVVAPTPAPPKAVASKPTQAPDDISQDAPADSAPSAKPDETSSLYSPPSAMRQFAPILPESVRRAIRGAVVVRVRVSVDADGQVTGAEPLPDGQPVAEPIAMAATTAVKRWQFEPARRGTERIPAQTVLSFTFRR